MTWHYFFPTAEQIKGDLYRVTCNEIGYTAEVTAPDDAEAIRRARAGMALQKVMIMQ